MEMYQIRYFLTLCETLNFTKAAMQCNVAQPSLSRAIKMLEEELGGPLFHRARNRTHCTRLGNLMRPQLQKILDASELALSLAQKVSALEVARLDLGIMCTIGPSRMISFISRLRMEIPDLDLRLHDAPGSELIERMKSGDLDLAILGMPKIPDIFHAHTLYSERYVVAFPKGHRFEQMDTVPLSALNHEDYLDRTNCEYSEYLKSLDAESEPKLNILYQSDRETWIQASLLAGMGCAVMPEYLPILPGIATRNLVEPDIRRDIQLITVAGRRHPPAVEAFVRLTKRFDWNAGHCV